MTGAADETAQIEPQQVWPRGAGAAAFRLVDVRAPVEVGKHALPGACNLPILSDEERHEVGACYHQRGHDAAVALGVELTASDASIPFKRSQLMTPAGLGHCPQEANDDP